MNGGTLILTRRDVAALLSIEECTKAVEHVFRLYEESKTQAAGVLAVRASDGGFHIKAGVLQLNRPYFAAKINANFSQNPKRLGRTSSNEVIVFDSTGMALQDVVSAALVYEKAKQQGAGTTIELIG